MAGEFDRWDDPVLHAKIGLLVLVFLLLAGLIAWLIFAGDDDDVGPDSSRLIIELSDGTGQPVDRGMLATVVGPPGEETAFEWTEPDDAPDGATAGGPTGTDGRIDFEWEIDDEIVTDPDGWTLRSADGSRGAHSEHTIAITADGPLVLTARD